MTGRNHTDGNTTFNNSYIYIVATIPSDTFFAVGFGESLYSSDVIMFRAFTSIDKVEVRDMHFSRDKPPVVDETEDLADINFTINEEDNTVSFNATRLFVTGDSCDYPIVTDTEFPMVWASSGAPIGGPFTLYATI